MIRGAARHNITQWRTVYHCVDVFFLLSSDLPSLKLTLPSCLHFSHLTDTLIQSLPSLRLSLSLDTNTKCPLLSKRIVLNSLQRKIGRDPFAGQDQKRKRSPVYLDWQASQCEKTNCVEYGSQRGHQLSQRNTPTLWVIRWLWIDRLYVRGYVRGCVCVHAWLCVCGLAKLSPKPSCVSPVAGQSSRIWLQACCTNVEESARREMERVITSTWQTHKSRPGLLEGKSKLVLVLFSELISRGFLNCTV